MHATIQPPTARAPAGTATPSMAMALAMALALSSCGGGGAASKASVPAETALSAQAALGEKVFADVSLSAPGRQAYASCHSKANAHAPEISLAVQLGGPLLDKQGKRVAPSLRYLSFNTGFQIASDGAPSGGFFWDGRASSLQAQAHEPLLDVNEMANTSAADVVDKLSRASYADEFKRVFGADIFTRPDDALARLALALQQYQREDTDFRPFSSRYDEFLRGKVALSDAEPRGLGLFNSPAKGNCQACHPSAKASDGSFPLFTDFSYDNLGVPRNTALAQNADPAFFDLGLCARTDLAARTDLCGDFKVPSLRNVALRHAYFHNGHFATLKDALTFYVQRDTNPEKWYPLNPDGSVKKFDDLPTQYAANVNTAEVPYTRRKGELPFLNDAEVDDVIAFLSTLSDGCVR